MKGINSIALLAAAVAGFSAIPNTASADEGQRWEGCSIGLETSQFSTTVTFPNGQPEQELDTYMVGPVAACRLQFESGLVLGVGGRAAFGEAEDYNGDGNEIRQLATSDGLMAITLEVGWAFDDNAYVYFEAGQGWMSLEQREICMDPATIPFGFCRAANGYAPYDLSQEETEEGTVLGAGLLIALSDEWSLSGRYSRYEFEGARYDNMGPASNGLTLPTKIVEEHDADVITVGLNYTF